MTPIYASMFTGGDLGGVGLRQAGYQSAWGVEYCPEIADVAEANGSARVIRSKVEDVDYSKLERPDLLWASPECKEFSQAKTAGAEGPIQRAQSEAVCRALETLTPRLFVLENVVGYRRSRSLAHIVATLSRLGYMYQLTNVNAADMGVPQTRRRLILRAVRGWLVPHFPRKVRWVGWYAAIADLIPTLPESAFANWQLARLEPLFGHTLVEGNSPTTRPPLAMDAGEPCWTVRADANKGIPRAFLVGTNGEHGDLCRGADSPAQTIAATHLAEKHRAFLIGGGNTQLAQVDSRPRWEDRPAFTVAGNESATTNQRVFIVDGKANSDGETVTVRGDGEPCFTIAAHAGKQAARAWLEQGRVVSMTPRALARFQSVPDSYVLPEKRALACTVIGNGVSCLVAQAIGESLKGAI